MTQPNDVRPKALDYRRRTRADVLRILSVATAHESRKYRLWTIADDVSAALTFDRYGLHIYVDELEGDNDGGAQEAA